MTGRGTQRPQGVSVSENQGNTRKESIAEAISKVLAGDVNAYEIIYKNCDEPLRSFVTSRYGGRGRYFVDEVLSRTHIYAFAHLGAYDAGRGASFQTWLNWQSRNEARMVAIERYGPRFEPLDEDVHAPVIGIVPDPADVHRADENCRVLWQEYRALAEAGRLSIAFHDIEERTFAVTARHMSMTVAKVRRMRDGALAELRRRLRRLGLGARSFAVPEPPLWSVRSDTGRENGWSEPAGVMEPDGSDERSCSVTEPIPMGE